MNRLFVVLAALIALSIVPSGHCSEYLCDPDYQEQGYCVFMPNDGFLDEGLYPVEPFKVDINIGRPYYRCLIDGLLSTMCVSPGFMPINAAYYTFGYSLDAGNIGSDSGRSNDGDSHDGNGAAVESTYEKLTGTDWNWVLIFEMMAPLENALRFTPWDLVGPDKIEGEWERLNKMVYDCHIKEEDEMRTDGGDWWIIPGRETIREMLYPNKNLLLVPKIVRYFEETYYTLICIMSYVDDDDVTGCADARARVGIKPGETSDCWVEAYQAIWDELPMVDTPLQKSIWESYPPLQLTPISDPSMGEGTLYIESMGLDFTLTARVDATLYCVAVLPGGDYPNALQIQLGIDAEDIPAESVYITDIYDGVEVSFKFEQLTDGQAYEAYCATDTGVTTQFVWFIACSTSDTYCENDFKSGFEFDADPLGFLDDMVPSDLGGMPALDPDYSPGYVLAKNSNVAETAAEDVLVQTETPEVAETELLETAEGNKLMNRLSKGRRNRKVLKGSNAKQSLKNLVPISNSTRKTRA